MIWYYIITFFDNFFSSVFDSLGIPRVEELPFGLDEYLTTAVQSFKAFAEIFPPLGVIFEAFLWYLGFKLTLVVVRNIPFVRLRV